jgi:hypothetical protein
MFNSRIVTLGRGDGPRTLLDIGVEGLALVPLAFSVRDVVVFFLQPKVIGEF